jgi:hypothetical protein
MSPSPLVITVVSGPGAGRRYRLEGTTTVGRAAHCSIPMDAPGVSREHFELQPEGGEWAVQDSGSRNGTYLNGRAVKKARIRPGDEIQAGDVVMRVEEAARSSGRIAEPTAAGDAVDDTITVAAMRLPLPIFEETEPTLSATAEMPATDSLLAALTGSLSDDPDVHLYALVDGAQAFDLAFAGRLMGHPMFTLFTGDLATVAAQSGPCLLAIGERSGFLAAWVRRAGAHAGILFEAAAEPSALGPHLRHIFIATDEEGQEYFFRFYDPRVLRTFLPTCREGELREFFGPVQRWIAEREDGAGYTVYTVDGGALKTRDVAAAATASR